MTSIYGDIKGGWGPEKGMRDTLKLWLPSYLREMERQTGRSANVLASPRSWVLTNDFRSRPGERLPIVLVVSPGNADKPVRDGHGAYRAPYDIAVVNINAAKDADTTRNLAQTYSAAIRAAVLQHKSLGGAARGTTWEGERYDDLPATEDDAPDIQLGAVRQLFVVEVEDVVNDLAGPSAVPAEPPPSADHPVQTIDVTVRRP